MGGVWASEECIAATTDGGKSWKIQSQGSFNRVTDFDSQIFARRNIAAFICSGSTIPFSSFDNPKKRFDRAVQKFPDFMEAHFNRAMIYKQKTDVPNTIRAFREVLRTGAPDDENVRWVRKFLDDFERSVRSTDGVSLDVYVRAADVFDRAFGCMEREEWKQAIALFQECIRLSPRNPKGYGNIGICYAKTGRRAKAIQALDTAIRLDPSYEPAILNRAVIERLKEDEVLQNDRVTSVDYAREYQMKGKSLLKSLFG